MRTQTKYEEITLGEIRTLPQAVKMLRSLREGVKSVVGRVGRKSAADTERTGFCGVWKDDRPADEIIADITAHRSGYGRRKVNLSQGEQAYRAG